MKNMPLSLRTLRPALTAFALTIGVLGSAGCSVLDTGSDAMTWDGADPLPKDDVTLSTYTAVPALPRLDLKTVAEAFGNRLPEGTDPDAASVTGGGKPGWRAEFKQTGYATSVRYQDGACDDSEGDDKTAIEATKASLAALGSDPDEYTWFTIPTAYTTTHVVGEPRIDDHPTWSTGIYSTSVDGSGRVCNAVGNLMGFEEKGEATLPSPSEVFQNAREHEALTIEGRYTSYEPTWTLDADGVVIPAWRFVAADHAIVMVKFSGEDSDWETAPDTQTYLTSPPQ